MSLKYEPSSEPLHISAKWLFLNSERYLSVQVVRYREAVRVKSEEKGGFHRQELNYLFCSARLHEVLYRGTSLIRNRHPPRTTIGP